MSKQKIVGGGGGGAGGSAGLLSVAMADADVVLSTSQASYGLASFSGPNSTTRSVTYPLPGTDADSYTRILANDTGQPLTVTVGAGTDFTLSDGETEQLMFTPAGVASCDTELAVAELSLVSSVEAISTATWTRVGARQVNLSPFPPFLNGLTRTARLKVDAEKTSGATSTDLRLYDVTHSVQVGGTLQTVSNTNEDLTELLTIGSAAGNLRSDAATMYELQMRMTGGVVGNDSATCTNARLLLTYE